MSVAMILLPLFVQVGLTFALLFALGPMRFRAIREGQVGREAALDGDAFPPRCRQFANAFRNQFELPVLFYVLTALALFTRKADIVFVVLAWVFVASRIVHAFVHVTSNDVRLRFPAFLVGTVALLIMWVLFALAILLNV
ncbi:MAPEG family protein [Aquabacter sp. L1I39]|uniref:MAPEG family protein n=1 Tax=Aquabacter sp. L1I39 TaxID=2820278 RepID=UPI001ADA0876|nr:MAPEG family protein [Aquabacter sp. L1I39]QTL05562.1 MAPEG family protein [Aquabacter sp. L1I39]